MSRRLGLVILAAAAVTLPLLLRAGSVTGLATFTNGSVADATAVNANFVAVKSAVDDNHARLSALEGAAVPAGMVMPYAGTTCPAGWLAADGASVSRAAHPALFASIGTAHGAADASSFNLPDYRGRFLRGAAGSSGRDPNAATRTAMNAGGATGNAVGTLQGGATALPTTGFTTSTTGNHAHPMYHALLQGLGGGPYNYTLGASLGAHGTSGSTLGGGDHAHTVNGGGDSETRPVNASVNYCIKH